MMDFDAAARRAFERVSASLSGLRLAVVGDVMLDQFVYGAVERISPEAPVPVVEVDREVYRLGGAANVVHNLRSLGTLVDLVGVVGADPMAAQIRQELDALGLSSEGLVEVEDRPTAIKTRVIAQHQQVVRFDRERRGALGVEGRRRLLERLRSLLPTSDAVVVSDYGKGVVDGEIVGAVLEATKRRRGFVAVDPKPPHASCYHGVHVVTPNTKEVEEMTQLPARTDDEAVRAGLELMRKLDTASVLVTRGERGMTLLSRDAPPLHIPTRARDVFDVTGAGDTTISVLTLGRAAGAELTEAACLANLAAGVVVGKLGTAVVTPEELRHATGGGLGSGAGTR